MHGGSGGGRGGGRGGRGLGTEYEGWLGSTRSGESTGNGKYGVWCNARGDGSGAVMGRGTYIEWDVAEVTSDMCSCQYTLEQLR